MQPPTPSYYSLKPGIDKARETNWLLKQEEKKNIILNLFLGANFLVLFRIFFLMEDFLLL